ncbi:MAG: YebC/PmpR family DNA-binding transcriptional regulator [Clostridia bacterium]|nr:YebC/PmpR family DNA-binding transcriptional regulator [Clostridia bacterium]
MAGHSKWHNRMHRKARQDEKKGKIFSKMAREIAVAVRQGGADPDGNPRLRLALERARALRVPQENIDRAIQRGQGGVEGTDFEELYYEGYGPGGAALMLKILTDNRNRTASEIRHLFSRNGGSLGESGCVAWMFERKGLLVVDRAQVPVDEETVLLWAAEAGAEDVEVEDGRYTIITAPEDFDVVRAELERQGLRFAEADLAMVAKTEVRLEGREAEQFLRLADALEDHDDVQAVYTNASVDEDALVEMGA